MYSERFDFQRKHFTDNKKKIRSISQLKMRKKNQLQVQNSVWFKSNKNIDQTFSRSNCSNFSSICWKCCYPNEFVNRLVEKYPSNFHSGFFSARMYLDWVQFILPQVESMENHIYSIFVFFWITAPTIEFSMEQLGRFFSSFHVYILMKTT